MKRLPEELLIPLQEMEKEQQRQVADQNKKP